MKKIYSLLALLLCFFTGTMNVAADDVAYTWTLSEDYATAADIKDGAYIALRQGTYASLSSNMLLTYKNEFVEDAAFNDDCVFQLEATKKSDDGYQLYVLKSVGNDGMYLADEGYTLSKDDAFECSILPALFDTDNFRQSMDAANKGTYQTTAADGVAFVFTEGTSDSHYHLIYYGSAYYIWDYDYCNDWFVHVVTREEATPQQQLSDLYTKIFGSGCDETIFHAGTDPGCTPQSVYEQLLSAYEAATDALDKGDNLSDEEAKACVAQIQAAYEAYTSSTIMPEAGKYYTFTNNESGGTLYESSEYVYNTSKKLSSPVTLADAKFIWKTEKGTNGMYYLKNLSTGCYLGSQATELSLFPTTKKAESQIALSYYKDNVFLMYDSPNTAYLYAWGSWVVRWDDSGVGNQWLIHEVSADELADILPQIEKDNFLSSLNDLINEASQTKSAYQYDTDMTWDGNYDSNYPGLVTTMTGNRTETAEGSIEGAFDGDLSTFYHTNWKSSATFDDYDWVQVDLGADYQDFFLKVTQRETNRNGNPSKFALVAPAAGEDLSGAWTDTLCVDTLIYQFSTPYSSGTIANTTGVAHITLDKAVQNLRFVVLATKANQHYGGIGPCWHAAEIRFYENRGTAARYALIPEDVIAALEAQLTNAKAKLADSTATQDDYDALEAAYEAFLDAYPDDSRLTALIEEANTLATTTGLEGDGLGYYESGAQSALASAVESINTAKADKVLTLNEIDEYLTQLRAAISAFNAKLHVPEDGALVRLKSNSTSNYVYAYDADSAVTNVFHGYNGDTDLDYRLNAIWKLQKNEDGTFAIRNLATGHYIQNLYKGVADPDDVELSQAVSSVDTPDGFTFTTSLEGGIFAIEMAEDAYLNTASTGYTVNWNERTDNSAFVLESVDAADLETSTIDITSSTMQIITLPYAVQETQPRAYKVLGQKDGYVQLSMYATTDVIPAGTPFIINPTDEDGTLLQVFLANSGADFLNEEYNYEHVEQNGLVGTSQSIYVDAGLGTLVDNVVKTITSSDYVVYAGAGYFKGLPETTEDGELTIKIEGTLTGINNAVVVKNVPSDVYTLTGVKVRSAVKATDATNGLPAGLYIVGGKKVLVK